MWSVIRYHHLLRSGVSWKINKNIVELWHDSLSDSESDKTSTLSLFIDENDNGLDNIDNNALKTTTQWQDAAMSDSEVEDIIIDEKLLGEGSDEDDSLLVIYEEPANMYWQ